MEITTPNQSQDICEGVWKMQDLNVSFELKNVIFFLESGGNVEWLGDGFCDDKNNNLFCHFDNADCCGIGVNKQFCIDCDCISKPKIFDYS